MTAVPGLQIWLETFAALKPLVFFNVSFSRKSVKKKPKNISQEKAIINTDSTQVWFYKVRFRALKLLEKVTFYMNADISKTNPG